MTDERDPLILLSEARAYLAEKHGRSVCRTTLNRWIDNGVRGQRLRTFRFGGWWHTRRSWIDAFMERLNPTPAELDLLPTGPSPSDASRSQAAKAELIRRGLIRETSTPDLLGVQSTG